MCIPGTTRAETAARSTGGLLTLSQLKAAGCSPDAAERQVRAQRWQRPARAVYALHERELTGLELGRAASLLTGTPVVISGLVVLRELGLRWIPARPHVLALVEPAVRTPSSGQVVLRRTKQLGDLQTWRRAGLDLAPPARAIVDGARELDRLQDVRGVVLGAVTDGWADVEELRTVLAATQRNGSGLCRRALLDAERGCASPPEAELVDALIGCGQPFYVNPELWLDGRLLGMPDVWLVGTGTGGEVESRERHEGDDADVESTYDRHERMTAPGIELVHLSVRRIRADVHEAAAHLLRRAAAAARSRLEPPGLVVVPRGPLLS